MMTVLLPTYNGADTLPEALAAYCNLAPPQEKWNLVIVDNASTDETKTIIDSFSSRLPLTYVFEPRLGKNIALNSGLRFIDGDLVLFTDDDTLPAADWLQQARALAESQPSFAIFGGAILPQWEVVPPKWLVRFPFPSLGITDPNWEEGPTMASRVWGGNMLTRTEVFRAGHRFNECLGPVGNCYATGEEAEFVSRLAEAGFRAWYCNKIVVRHMIRRSQMRKEWLLRRAAVAGRDDYRRFLLCHPIPSARLFGFPRYLVRQIAEEWVRTAFSQVFRDAVSVFNHQWRLSYLIAQALEGRQGHKLPNRIGIYYEDPAATSRTEMAIGSTDER